MDALQALQLSPFYCSARWLPLTFLQDMISELVIDQAKKTLPWLARLLHLDAT
jgi:hypothetical protein